MNTKDVRIVKRIKPVKHCWKADHNFSWHQKKVFDRESRLNPWKIKEVKHSLQNPDYINNVS